jgi:hypothetical protein
LVAKYSIPRKKILWWQQTEYYRFMNVKVVLLEIVVFNINLGIRPQGGMEKR